VAVGSVAKGPTRRSVDLYGTDWKLFPQLSTEAWQIVTELLREEAHRFAITYYRNLHRRALLGLN
jgi:excinuclease UvrABC nuclease subunit